MRLRMLGMIVASLLSLAVAQGVYLGGGTSLPLGSGLSAQLGIGLVAGFELRTVLEGSTRLGKLGSASTELLYTVPLPSSRLYLGAGADVFFGESASLEGAVRRGALGAHAVGGAELRVGSLGLFGELQPGLRLERTDPFLRTRLGVNLHF